MRTVRRRCARTPHADFGAASTFSDDDSNISRVLGTTESRHATLAAHLAVAPRADVPPWKPSFKLASKTRIGAKVRKTYHAPETPYAKLLACAAISAEMKDRLRAVAVQLDPFAAPGRDSIGATPLSRAVRRGRRRTWRFATMATWTASSRVLPRRGNTARSAPLIAASRDPRVIGGLGQIRSSASGPACARGSRPSPIASVEKSSCACRGNYPGSSPMANCAPFSAESESGTARFRFR